MDRVKTAKHTLQQVLEIIQDRISFEEEYAKKLAKLSKNLIGKDEDGTLSQGLESFRNEMESHGRIRIALADELKQKLEKPLNAFFNDQRESRKEKQIAVEKSLKLKTTQVAVVQKAEEKYRKACMELENLKVTYSNSKGSKDADKHESKMQKALVASKQADAEYQAAVDKLREIHTIWVKDMYAAAEEFQSLEETRIDYTRNLLWNYANAHSSACVEEDKLFERLRQALEKIDVQKDIQDFIKKKGTGTAIPGCLEYKNFYENSVPKKAIQNDTFAQSKSAAGTTIAPSQTSLKQPSQPPMQQVQPKQNQAAITSPHNPFFSDFQKAPDSAPVRSSSNKEVLFSNMDDAESQSAPPTANLNPFLEEVNDETNQSSQDIQPTNPFF